MLPSSEVYQHIQLPQITHDYTTAAYCCQCSGLQRKYVLTVSDFLARRSEELGNVRNALHHFVNVGLQTPSPVPPAQRSSAAGLVCFILRHTSDRAAQVWLMSYTHVSNRQTVSRGLGLRPPITDRPAVVERNSPCSNWFRNYNDELFVILIDVVRKKQKTKTLHQVDQNQILFALLSTGMCTQFDPLVFGAFSLLTSI